MTEPKDGPWRGNIHYLHQNALKDIEQPSLTEVHSENALSFPKQLDWENPNKEQQRWMKRILQHIPEAYIDIFQEYGLGRKDGKVICYNDDADRKIGLSREVSGGNGANNSSLYPIFGQEFANYYDRSNGKWHMFLYLDNYKSGPKVFGGGKMHFGDMGRTYWNGLRLDFDDIGEARTFLDTVKEHPRAGLELYLQTLFENKFSHTHYDGRKLGGMDKFMFNPFDETHGSLEISTKDLTIPSEG